KQIKEALAFEKLELVPAPKTSQWEFIPPKDPLQLSSYKLIWQPKVKREENGGNDEDTFLKLRPLAHIAIREQTIITLIMMCLANKVETIQGDPATELKDVHNKKVVSYGNRLYCRYDEGTAEHSYGATTTYSKYFTDYRRFLERPYYFAREALEQKSEDESVNLIGL